MTLTDFHSLTGGSSVKQVTYAGYPLYRFFLDETPGDTEGTNLDDPVTSPPGVWYLVDPAPGHSRNGSGSLAARDRSRWRHRPQRDCAVRNDEQ